MAYTGRFYYDGGKKPWFVIWQNIICGGDDCLTVSPCICMSRGGGCKSFLQIYDRYETYIVECPSGGFEACGEKYFVRLGKNIFSSDRMILCCDAPGLELRGEVRLSDFTPLRATMFSPSLMGPLSYVSFLKYYRDVISLTHFTAGEVSINGRPLSFSGGSGYIDMSWGSSLPFSWIWYQCCCFSDDPSVSIMVYCCGVPYSSSKVNAVAAVCRADGREYRFASYYGAHMYMTCRTPEETSFCIVQNDCKLKIRVKKDSYTSVFMPSDGQMNRVVREYTGCYSHAVLSCGNTVIFDGGSLCSSFQEVGEAGAFLLERTSPSERDLHGASC